MTRVSMQAWNWMRSTFDIAYLLLVAAVLVLLAWNVHMGFRQRALTLQLAQNSSGLSGPASAVKGDLLPSFSTIDTSGVGQRTSFDGTERRLLFIFSVQCVHCRGEAPYWRRLAGIAHEHGVAATWISIDRLDVARKGAARFEPQTPVLLMPNDAVSRAYRVTAVPQVSLVSASGVIEWTHTGTLTEQERAELESRVSANAR